MPLLLGGISLSQYAGVTAALAERFELSAILEQEQIDPAAWPAASRAWTEAIVEAPDLQVELVRQRRIAEDCLGRAISPLDTDPAAWAGLLGALALSDTPASVTGALGITMADVARLGRRWKRKMEADPELAKQVAELAPTAKPPARVDAAKPKLAPFPWTPVSKPASPEARTSPEAELAARIIDVGSEPAQPPRRELASFQLKEQEPPPAAPTPVVPVVQIPPVAPGLPSAVAAQITAWSPSTPPTEPATPFEALEPGAEGVTLLRYAQLVTLIQQPGVDAKAVLASFGIDPAKHKSIEAHYEKKFAREARWASEFGRLMSQAQRDLRERRAAEANKPKGTGTLEAPIPTPPAAPLPPPPAPPAPSARPHPGAVTRPPRSRAPELSMEQYAWVTATLQKTPPEGLAEVLARLRLTHETRAELDTKWRARIAADPALRDALAAAIARHLDKPPVAPSPPKLAGTALAPETPPSPATPFTDKPRK